MEYPELEGPHKDYPCPGSNELKSVLPEALGVFHQNSTQCWSAPREDKVQDAEWTLEIVLHGGR